MSSSRVGVIVATMGDVVVVEGWACSVGRFQVFHDDRRSDAVRWYCAVLFVSRIGEVFIKL